MATTYKMHIEATLVKCEEDGEETKAMVASLHYEDMDYTGVVAVEGCIKQMTDGLYALGEAKANALKAKGR